MQNVKTQIAPDEKTKVYEKVVLSIFKNFKKGNLQLRMPNGEVLSFGDKSGYSVDIQINHSDFFKKCVLYADIGFGESYCDGDWETNDLTMLIRWAIDNVETSGFMSGSKVKAIGTNLMGSLNKLAHKFNKNSKKGSQENISYHYDLSNDFYQLMLDETMSYSCGIFNNEDSSLYEAQITKLEHICKDLDIKATDHILEIGCGWGGFAIHAAINHGCKVTGVTISKEQYEFSKQRVKENNLEDQITILLQDYRDLNGEFEKIVSIEMIEAVGHEYLPQYFKIIDKLLKKDGVAVIQAITSPDSRYDSFRRGVDFIQKHIFPGSLLPSIGAMVGAYQKTDLHLVTLRDIGLHYSKTLRCWWATIEKKWYSIKELGMDDNFYRKWKYYMSYCEAAFRERNISTVQITLMKPNNNSSHILDYLNR